MPTETTPIDPDPDFSDKIRARAQLNERLSRIEAKLDLILEGMKPNWLQIDIERAQARLKEWGVK